MQQLNLHSALHCDFSADTALNHKYKARSYDVSTSLGSHGARRGCLMHDLSALCPHYFIMFKGGIRKERRQVIHRCLQYMDSCTPQCIV